MVLLVLQLGMEKRLAWIALTLFCAKFNCLCKLVLERPKSEFCLCLIGLFGYAIFSTIGSLFGNLRAIAMGAYGHISKVLGLLLPGFISTMLAIPIATYVGVFIHGQHFHFCWVFPVCGCNFIGIYVEMRNRMVLASAIIVAWIGSTLYHVCIKPAIK